MAHLLLSAAPLPRPAPPLAEQMALLWADVQSWLVAHGAEVLIASVAGALIYLVLRVVRRWVRRRAVLQADADGFSAVALRTLARTRHFFLIMAALRLVVGYANAPPLIDQTIRFLFIVAAALQAAIWAKELIMALVRQRAAASHNETLSNALSLINVLVTIGVFLFAIIMVLDNVGVNVTGLIAGLGIGGIAIGLAAKGVFEDLFAALAIIFDRPFRKGDTVQFDTTTATVERVGLKSTRLRAVTGEEVIVSNTHLLSKQIANFARLSRRRMALPIGVTFETPAAKLRAIPVLVEEIVTAQGAEPVRCGIVRFGTSSIDFDIQFDVPNDDYAAVFAARHAIALALVERFAREGIAFAYPTQVSYSAAPDGTLVMPWASDSHGPVAG